MSVCLSVKLNHEDLERQSLDNFISYPKELQHGLSTKIAGDSATDIIIQAQSDRDAVRLRSLQGRGAGAWLDVIPTSAKYALKTNEFSLASYLRLGVALSFTNWIKKCDFALQCLIQILDRIWILMCPWLIHGVRTSLGGLARKWSCCRDKRRQENEKILRRACSRRICIKMCSSCDRTFWEVGHKGREVFAAFVTTISKSRRQF